MDATTNAGSHMSEVQVAVLGPTKEEAKRLRGLATWRRYYARNSKKLYLRKMQWNATHPDKLREALKRSYRKNVAKRNSSSRAWRQKHPEKMRESSTNWAARNPEKVRAAHKRYVQNNREKHRLHTIKRRAKLRTILSNLTISEWRTVLLAYNSACAYCYRSDVPLEKDHVIPISRGGHHTKENVVPACRSCNAKKGNRINYPVESVPPVPPWIVAM